MSHADHDNDPRDTLRNQVVVVTGAGHGIGRAAALAAASNGAHIVAADLSLDSAANVAEEAESLGSGSAVGVRCDVTDEASVEALLSTATELGDVRGLVTSAGIDVSGLVHELPLATWQRVLDVNLTGTFLACKHALRAMVAHGRGGSVVCVSSPFAEVSAPGGASAYCASKGGVSSMVRSMALDYAPFGIRVNAVVPGTTETALMWANVPEDEVGAMRSLISSQVPLARLASPEDIAPGITWLLSDESRYSTGSQLVIDGGLLAKGSVAC